MAFAFCLITNIFALILVLMNNDLSVAKGTKESLEYKVIVRLPFESNKIKKELIGNKSTIHLENQINSKINYEMKRMIRKKRSSYSSTSPFDRQKIYSSLSEELQSTRVFETDQDISPQTPELEASSAISYFFDKTKMSTTIEPYSTQLVYLTKLRPEKIFSSENYDIQAILSSRGPTSATNFNKMVELSLNYDSTSPNSDITEAKTNLEILKSLVNKSSVALLSTSSGQHQISDNNDTKKSLSLQKNLFLEFRENASLTKNLTDKSLADDNDYTTFSVAQNQSSGKFSINSPHISYTIRPRYGMQTNITFKQIPTINNDKKGNRTSEFSSSITTSAKFAFLTSENENFTAKFNSVVPAKEFSRNMLPLSGITSPPTTQYIPSFHLTDILSTVEVSSEKSTNFNVTKPTLENSATKSTFDEKAESYFARVIKAIANSDEYRKSDSFFNESDSLDESFSVYSGENVPLSHQIDYKDILLHEYISSFMEDSSLYAAPDGCSNSYETCLPSMYSSPKKKKLCMCTEECLEYGNCCLDYPLDELRIDIHGKKRWSCSKIGTSYGYYVISSCPRNWYIDHVRQLCEVANNSNLDKFSNIPASGKKTLLTYRNVYCAICNNDLNSSFWLTHLHCPRNTRLRNINEKNIHDCGISFSPPNFNGKGIKSSILPLVPCDTDLIDKCSEEWKSNAINEYSRRIWAKCEMTNAPAVGWIDDDVVKYKNVFCAICNNVSEDLFLCPGTDQGPPDTPVGQPAFSLLLDMDFTQGGTIVGAQERCPEMHLYDPWIGKCRNVMCGSQYIFQNNNCILKTDTFLTLNISDDKLSEFNNSLNSDCLRIAYTSKEFTVFQNRTITIRSGSIVLQPNEYEIIDNDTIGVCAPKSMSKYVATFTNVQGSVTIAGISISLVSLFIKICITLFTREKRKLPSKIVLFLSVSLFLAQLLFLFGIARTDYKVICVIIGILIHYFFLSTFFWMNVLAYDLWKTFATSKSISKSIPPKRQLLWYCLYGWLTPLAVVFCSIMAEFAFSYSTINPYYGKAVCWISNKIALAVFFGAPLAILLLSNVSFFVVTAIEIRKTTIATKIVLENSNKSCSDTVQFSLYCKLAFIMGLTWCFGFIAAFAGSMILWYLFIIFNSIQGVYVLLAFTHFHYPWRLKPEKLKHFMLRQSTVSRSSLTMTSSLSKT